VIPADPGVVALLAGGHYNVHVHANILRRDFSPLLVNGIEVNTNFMRGTITASIDDAARRCTATFALGSGDESLSPHCTSRARSTTSARLPHSRTRW